METKKVTTPKLVFGIGINNADYVVEKRETVGYVNGKRKQKLIWRCPFYQTWKEMLKRCYCEKFQHLNPAYKGCTVSEEWLTFSNFRKWMRAQNWEGLHLDKDLLSEGNKVYSADTCVFITQAVNNFTIDSGAIRGEWLIGVSLHKQTGKLVAQCSNPFTKKSEHLGLFTSEQDAHEAWLSRKLELAYGLAATQTDSRVAEALINRYLKYKHK